MTQRIKPINGWTKEAMIARIRERVPEGGAYEVDRVNPSIRRCLYRVDPANPSSGGCAVGAFIPDDAGPEVLNARAPASTLFNQHPFLRRLIPLPEYWMTKLQCRHDDPIFSLESVQGSPRDAVIAWIEENVA